MTLGDPNRRQAPLILRFGCSFIYLWNAWSFNLQLFHRKPCYISKTIGFFTC